VALRLLRCRRAFGAKLLYWRDALRRVRFGITVLFFGHDGAWPSSRTAFVDFLQGRYFCASLVFRYAGVIAVEGAH